MTPDDEGYDHIELGAEDWAVIAFDLLLSLALWVVVVWGVYRACLYF